MRLQQLDADRAIVELRRSDLALVANVLNYVCNAVDLPEFATLFGAERDTADDLLAAVIGVLGAFDPEPGP